MIYGKINKFPIKMLQRLELPWKRYTSNMINLSLKSATMQFLLKYKDKDLLGPIPKNFTIGTKMQMVTVRSFASL